MKQTIDRIMKDQGFKTYISFANHYGLPIDTIKAYTSRGIKAGFAWHVVLALIEHDPDTYTKIKEKVKI